MAVELTEAFFASIAGWEAMKQARSLLAADKVLSSNWTEPVLRGVVQEGGISYRAGLVIKSERDIENICTCRQSRDSGAICAHSVGVGLRHLKGTAPPGAPAKEMAKAAPARQPARPGKRVQRAAGNTGAEAAEIHIILPPNFAIASEKGKAMACFEASWSGGRCPLSALPAARAFAFDEQDQALLDRLETLAGGETPGMLILLTSDFVELLPLLAEHPRITLGKSAPLRVTTEPWMVPLKARLEPNGELVLSLKQPGQAPALINPGWVFHGQVLQPLALPESCAGVWRGPVRLPRPAVPQFLTRDWPRLQESSAIEADFRVEDFEIAPQPPRFLLQLAGGLARLQGQLQCAYGPRILTLGASSPSEGVWLPDPESICRYGTRDARAEQEAVGLLRSCGFSGPDDGGKLELCGENRVLNFFARVYPRLQKEWSVTLEERLEKRTLGNVERIEPRFEIRPTGMQWFDFSVSYESSGGEKLSAADVQRLILSGQSYTRLRSGKVALLDTGGVEELQEVLRDCSPEQAQGSYRMANRQAGFLDATLRQHGWNAQSPASWRDQARQQSGQAKLECPPLGHLEAVLRPYQKEGVAWLHFLCANGFGGILADEMGLGKTLQVLALIQSRTAPPSQPGGTAAGGTAVSHARSPALVICPTSIVSNWAAEAAKFSPSLKVLALHGPDRFKDFPRIPGSDLVVTSYALIRRDLDRYQEHEFDLIVLDEAQHIKNRQTQNAQAVKLLRSRHRLVLTGTPMENSVLDLWSIFDFLMPGYLGAAGDFRDRYELPMTREANSDCQGRLARRLRPFLLRRLKRDVAADLPPKLEQVAYCELSEDQRAIYRQIMEAGRQEVLQTAGAGIARNRIAALNALLRLRQVCCDPRLLKLEAAGSGDDSAVAPPSGKIELFSELLDEILDGGHRVLVFSQFVSMLTLLRQQLEAEGVEYCYLDGSTRDRAGVVGRFQNGSAPVFLISLKAGGVGLNLSAADTVIHFDPWWNPAVENQATDRAHRIGQTRVVTSYKLIARGTVEEKILQLQQRKRDLIQATVGGEEPFVQSLTWDEIQGLLSPDAD